MKKSQLPENIRIHCPEGLSEEQVEAWLLGYLASNPQSGEQGSAEHIGGDFTAHQPDETAPKEPRTEKPETYKELQDQQSDAGQPERSVYASQSPSRAASHSATPSLLV